MKRCTRILIACAAGLFLAPFVTHAGDGDWKKGRIYYRMVCTECHKAVIGKPIAPSVKTKAEWGAYLDADSHAGGKDKVSYQVSKAYRESIKDTNRAAAKFIKVDDAVLLEDVKAFVIHGAKDSDSPAGCQ